MTKQEAIDLENKADELMTEALGENAMVSLALSEYLRVMYDDGNIICINRDGRYVGWVKYSGFKEDLEDDSNKILKVVRENQELFQQLIWSYENRGELEG